VRTHPLLFASIAASVGTAFAPAPASACGGLFCSTAPVVQSGEEIVYALEDDASLTMSVRLFYAGSDPDIAWVLPLPAVPEVSVGSTALFTQLRAATAPTFYQTRTTEGACRPEPACVTASGAPTYAGGCGYSSGGSGGWMGGYVDAGARADAAAVATPDTSIPDGGVVVFSREVVGPYDTVVLGAATAMEVTDWLASNGYQLPAGTTALLDHYATTSHVFLALRLAPGHAVSEIAPITMHMPVSAPCLPIRLTALATAPDLPITAWFLGRARVVPANYSIVTPDYADERYWTLGGFYQAEMTRQTAAAGGQAFVTEYAGPTPALTLTIPPLADPAHTSVNAIVGDLLVGGYFATQADALRILGAHVMPPAGQALLDWLTCMSGRSTACGTATGDVAGLEAQVEQEIITPRRAAQAMIDAHPYVTRAFTSMSAAHMTLDPEFRVDDALPGVPATHEERTVTSCDATHYLSSAPTVTRIGTHVIRSTPGTLADDAAYCHSRGLYLPEEVRTSSSSSSSSSHGGLCGCRAGSGRFGLWPFAFALGALGWIRAERRRRLRSSLRR
jgi:hypothetical protein